MIFVAAPNLRSQSSRPEAIVCNSGGISLPHLFRRHSLRYRAFRGLAPTREISEIHDQQSGQAILQGRPRGQRSALFHAFRHSAVRVLVGQEKVSSICAAFHFPAGACRQIAGAGARHCVLEFPPQTFKIRNHGVEFSALIQHDRSRIVSRTDCTKSPIGKS